MPDKRLIDANALDLVPDIHNAMNGVIFVNHPRSGGRTQMIVQQLLTRMISNAPTIDAVPVVHAKWEWTQRGWCCSACCKPSLIEAVAFAKWCSRCGAKMDGGANDEN